MLGRTFSPSSITLELEATQFNCLAVDSEQPKRKWYFTKCTVKTVGFTATGCREGHEHRRLWKRNNNMELRSTSGYYPWCLERMAILVHVQRLYISRCSFPPCSRLHLLCPSCRFASSPVLLLRCEWNLTIPGKEGGGEADWMVWPLVSHLKPTILKDIFLSEWFGLSPQASRSTNLGTFNQRYLLESNAFKPVWVRYDLETGRE